MWRSNEKVKKDKKKKKVPWKGSGNKEDGALHNQTINFAQVQTVRNFWKDLRR